MNENSKDIVGESSIKDIPSKEIRPQPKFRLPPFEWLPNYQRTWLSSDVIAGITLATYAIPVSLAYASLAGLPPHYGIYCYLVAGFAYALFGTSRQLAVGPTSALAMLVGTTIAGMSSGDPTRAAAIAALTAMCVAVLGVIAWLLQLNGLVSFISETILTGFKAGAALTIGMTQLPKLFGVVGGGDHFFERIWILCGQLDQTNVVVLGLGIGSIALLIAGDKCLPGRPVALVVVALAIMIVSVAGLADRGVPTVGVIPPGLPNFTWPSLRPSDVDGVIPLAAACFLLAYVEGISAARALAKQHGYEVNPRQELLALAATNLAAAFGQGFPVSGGLSQSAVNNKAGAKTPLALVFASITIGVCLLFLTGLLKNLPGVVLAAIVLVAVKGLIDVPAIRRLWRISRFEFGICMFALVGVLLLGILKGVLLAVIVSVLILIAAVAQPNIAFLGRIPGTKRFSDISRHPENEIISGVLVFRVEASVVYFNAEHVRNVIWNRVCESSDLRLVVCDLSNAPYVDVAAATMLESLHKDLAEKDIQMKIVECRSSVRDVLRAIGFETDVGYLERHMSVHQAVNEFFDTKETTEI